MTDRDLERYVSLVCGMMRLRGKRRAELTVELRDHLQMRTEELEQKGVDHDEAVRRALEEFGDAQALAANLASVSYYRKKRWIMRLAIGSMTGLAGLMLLSTFLPNNNSSTFNLPPSSATAQEVARQTESSPPHVDVPLGGAIIATEEARLLKLLEKKGDFDFRAESLADVVTQLTQEFEVPLFLDASSLAELGVDEGTSITFSQENISLGAGLHHILRQVDLTIVPYESQILVTTEERAEGIQTPRFHPVWNLIVDPLNADAKPDYDTLIDVVTNTVAPASWEELGGMGNISGYKGLLVFSQTMEVQTQVADLLAELHRLPLLGGDLRDDLPSAIRIGQENEWHKTIETKLDDKVTEFEFLEEPLGDAVEAISQQYGIPLLLDQDALNEVGIDVNSPVTISLAGVSLRSALRLALESIGLTFVLHDEVLLITSNENAEAAISTVLYPVAGLIRFDTAQSLADLDDEFYDLIQLITTSLQADSWEQLGGYGTIAAFPNRGCLVVTQIDQVHRKIDFFLKALYQARRSPNVEPRLSPPDPNEIVMRIYQISPFAVQTDGDGKRIPVASDAALDNETVMGLVMQFVDVGSWRGNGVSITSVPGRLIVVHQRKTHDKIIRLLRKLNVSFSDDAGNAWDDRPENTQGGFGGGGFF